MPWLQRELYTFDDLERVDQRGDSRSQRKHGEKTTTPYLYLLARYGLLSV